MADSRRAETPPESLGGTVNGARDEACKRCDGCGQIANSAAGEPWTAWLHLPLGSSAAVLMGLIKPITCPTCGGSGAAA